MYSNFLAALVAASFVAFATAECPNACSAHGRCGAFDMCTCYRNWMSNDCSERVCQFGLAHVDSPKGDLDASSGKLSGPSTTVVELDAVYPYGTTEQYPNVLGAGGAVLENAAHQYMECSNKGVCDRQTGTCACFDGYSGSGCQRASCPSSSSGVCSGHGTCETVSTVAKWDFNNEYKLWDAESTMACVCDGGYSGADCSERMCKFGADPLYYDDTANIRYTNVTYEIYVQSSTAVVTGNYSIIFEDHTGEDWETGPIDIDATCDDVTDALEALPNDVIPSGSVLCYEHDGVMTGTNVPITFSGSIFVKAKYTLAFSGNPGYLKQMQINKYLDGSRPTLYSDEPSSTLAWHIYANGFIGEDTDYVPDLCEGVLVTLSATSVSTLHTQALSGLTSAEMKLLKKCLGDSDGDATNNVQEVYDWDYGSQSVNVELFPQSAASTMTSTYANPHLIKLIDKTQDITLQSADVQEDPSLWPYPKSKLCSATTSYINPSYPTGWCSARDPPGFYAVIFYDSTAGTLGEFQLLTRPASDYDSDTQFAVYTTTGYLQRVSPIVNAFSVLSGDNAVTKVNKAHSSTVYLENGAASNFYSSPVYAIPYTQPTIYHGGVDCVSNPTGRHYIADCLNKDDLVLFLNVDTNNAAAMALNPKYVNLHRVKKISREDSTAVGTDAEKTRNQIVLDYGVNTLYTDADLEEAVIYKFHPASTQIAPTSTVSLSQCTNALGTSLHTYGGYNYVSQCSGRGVCNTETGLCECFDGYTSDNCGVQNALAI
jgi:hypothetical protein